MYPAVIVFFFFFLDKAPLDIKFSSFRSLPHFFPLLATSKPWAEFTSEVLQMALLLYMLDICSWKRLRMSTRLLFSVGVSRPLATLNVSGCKWRSFTCKRRKVRQPRSLCGRSIAYSSETRVTCSKDFSPASFPTAVMSSNTALFTSCKKKKNSVTHSGMNGVMYSWSGGEPGVYCTYWILAQLLIRSHKPSLFSPVNKDLGVRHDYADEKRLKRKIEKSPTLNSCRSRFSASVDHSLRWRTCKLSPCTNTWSTGTQRM